MDLTELQYEMLDALCSRNNVSDEDREYIETELEALKMQFENPPANKLGMTIEAHSQDQVGYLAGVMDLERDDRLEMLTLLVGFPIWYDNEPYEGRIPIEDLPDDKQQLYPGPSSKDIRIDRYTTSVMIDWYLNNEAGHTIHKILGYTSKRAASKARAAQRAIARAAKVADKERRRLERMAKRAAADASQLTVQ